MTGKIGRTNEVQNWRVTCQTWLVCTSLLLQEERDCCTVCGIDSELWLDHLGVIFVSSSTRCLCAFPARGSVGSYFTASNTLWELLGRDAFLGAGNGDTLRDAGVRFPNQPAPEARCAGERSHPWDARREIFPVCAPGGKDKCAWLVGPSAGRGQSRGALKSEKWASGSVPGTDANEGETIQTAAQSHHSSVLH